MFSIITVIMLKFKKWKEYMEVFQSCSLLRPSGLFAALSITNIVASLKQFVKFRFFKIILVGFTYLLGLGALYIFQT